MIEQGRPSRADLLLDDLRDACQVAADIVRRGRPNYDRDEVIRFAAQMVIVRLSAVAQRLGSQAPVAIPDFDWTGLTRTRNKIVHEYPTIHERKLDDGAAPPPEGREG